MPAVFVHVSDIHFGQERDHVVHIHDDVKRELIADASEVVASLTAGVAQGVLVTGDIAYSGTWDQYEAAGEWLDKLAAGIGCEIHRVQMVPGNHDLDRDKLSVGGSKLLEYIREGGAAEYEAVIANENDRSTLFSRFEDYGRFSVGYNCGLDDEAKYATNLRIEVGPGRWIRFVRLNSALLCHGREREEPAELMIGARQFTIPRPAAGEEIVVLVHHPLHWYKDAQEVRQYVDSRVRVFISGHEHNPKVQVNKFDDNCDVMMLAAGAAVPFKSDDTYTYTYNIIEFDWDEASDSLSVAIHPRTWNPAKTSFEADNKRLGGSEPQFLLGSPNFRKAGLAAADSGPKPGADTPGHVPEHVEFVPTEGAEVDTEETATMPSDVEGYELALLRFFRDLFESDRLRILLALDAIPPESNERMNQGMERKLFDWLVQEGRLSEIIEMTDGLIAERNDGEM